ncbi:MAG: 1,4-alpha-glucan branching enzyme, partial [Saprospiraceae bacterium]|nr:1,4-alpha-glucan branching enzyme [Saprospiraceae bacterium]
MAENVIPHTLFTEFDISLFQTGKHFRLYEKFGSHPIQLDGVDGVYFAVFAPMAERVEVTGSFNDWQGEGYSLFVRWDTSGIWEGFIPGVKVGDLYKYQIVSKVTDQLLLKSDPYAFMHEEAPKSASTVWELDFKW